MAKGPPDANEVRPEVEQDQDTEAGQGLVEYAFILVLIALVLILAVTILGGQTKNLYSNIASAIPA